MRYDKAHTPDGGHCPQTTETIANPEYAAIPDVPRRINTRRDRRCVRSRWCQFPITTIRATVREKRRTAPHRSPDNPFGRGGKHLLGACRAEQSNAPSRSVPQSRCTFSPRRPPCSPRTYAPPPPPSPSPSLKVPLSEIPKQRLSIVSNVEQTTDHPSSFQDSPSTHSPHQQSPPPPHSTTPARPFPHAHRHHSSKTPHRHPTTF